MSSFAGLDLFGSGPHKITMGGESVAKKRTAFAGVDGVDSMTLGGRGWPVTITGLLKAANRVALDILITAIEDEIKNGPATLITTDDSPNNFYTNVELDRISFGSIMFASTEVMVRYTVTGLRLYP